jgi:hypothetical protein
MKTKKWCYGCGQYVFKLQQGWQNLDGSLEIGEIVDGWFHNNLKECSKKLVNKTKQKRRN